MSESFGQLARIIPTDKAICAVLKEPVALFELEEKISKAPFKVISVIEVI